jgi:hypothetical protein
MTSLEQFLNKENKPSIVVNEPASGSFSCQYSGCDEVVFEGYIDRVHSRIHWVCSSGHDSSVVI